MTDLVGVWRKLLQEGPAEVRLQTGQPIVARTPAGVRALSEEPLETPQVVLALAQLDLAQAVPTTDTPGEHHEIRLAGEACIVTIARRGDHLLVRVATAPVPGVPSAMPANPTPIPATPHPAPSASAVPRAFPPSTTPAPASTPAAGAQLDGKLVELLRRARSGGASDLHLTSGRPARIRRVGVLEDVGPAVDARTLEAWLAPLLSAERQEELQRVGHVDCAVQIEGAGRIRLNINRQRAGIKASMRLVDDQPRTLEELGLPPEVETVAHYHQGLVVVSGPSGHGKTTTLAALVHLLNRSRAIHIVTVEDPVEVRHDSRKAIVSQREVGRHTRSFQSALKGSLRQDPDVIVIGELRDRTTVEMALSAAETGHLVIATMAAPNGARTMDRLIDLFAPEEQPQVRSTLAGALKMVITQRLLPTADRSRLVPAVEILTGGVALWALIRDDKLFQLPSLLQRGKALGMRSLEESLAALLSSGIIDRATAQAWAEDARAFEETPKERPADDAPSERSGLRDLVGGFLGRKV